jgi:hypothetical protein
MDQNLEKEIKKSQAEFVNSIRELEEQKRAEEEEFRKKRLQRMTLCGLILCSLSAIYYFVL